MAKKERLRIALIGYGAISQTLFDLFRAKKAPIDIVARCTDSASDRCPIL